jgi:putative inorganic carbon (hco3(-)) transporter
MTESKAEGRIEVLHVLAILLVATGAAFVNDKLALVVLGGGLGFLAWRVWDHPEQVIGLLFTCFCAAPLLRRLHDVRMGWTPGSLLLVAPYVIFLPAAFRVLRQLPLFRRSGLIPMVVILGAILYAFLIGIWKNEMFASILGLLEWGCGPLVGVYILLSPNRPSPERLLRWVTTIAVVQVVYAFYQWIVLPAWDKAWLIDSMMYTSMGAPEPFLTRPWGTLNSTGPLAVFLVWFLIIAVTEKWFVLFAPGSVAMLVVTQVRAAWFTLGAGWAILFVLLPTAARNKATLKFVAIGIATLMIAVAYQDRVAGFAQRFQTIGNLKNDTSYRERAHLMNLSIEYLMNLPEGSGLGSDGRSARQSKAGVGGTLDNGFIAIVMVLGWVGAASYLGAFLFMLARGILAARRTSPRLVLHGVAATALLVANVFGTGFSDFVGVITFTSLAMCYRAAIDPPPALPPGIAT